MTVSTATRCSNAECEKELAPGQVVYEVGDLRYCEVCVKVNVVRYPRLIPRQRRADKTIYLP